MWHYSDERCERHVKRAYKISIRKSDRVDGVVTKKQFTVTTVDYYDFVDGFLALGDYDDKITAIAAALNTDSRAIYDLLDEKITPLQEKIDSEFQATDEYKTMLNHKKIIDTYNQAKAEFAKTYHCDKDEYSYCYDVFGNLMNADYLQRLISAYEQRRSYHEKKQNEYSSHHAEDDFNQNDHSSYSNLSHGNYNDDEKAILKKFYRTLSKEYHPDNTKGNHVAMQLVNKLKSAWGI